MTTHYPSHVRFAVPALVALTLVACARSSLQTDDQALAVPADTSGDDDAGLPTKPDDAGLGTKDDGGLGTKDAGLPTKDSGLGTADSGPAGDDSGSTGDDDSGSVAEDSGAEDSGVGTNDAGDGGGMTGTPDAGGGADPCMACAEQRCPIQTNLCLSAPACVAQGECELGCLSAPAKGIGGLAAQNRCFQSCVKNLQANIELTVAVSCALTLCPQQCIPELTALGE
jgi:hypothetical protein